jgi:hypothetical protein
MNLRGRVANLIMDLKLVIFFEVYWSIQVLYTIERRLRGDL